MVLKDYFKKAKREGWAMGEFNISNAEVLRAIIQAAQNLKSPVIIGTSEGESKFLGLRQATALVGAWKEETGLPVFLNLDHGKTLDYIKEAIDAGYDAVHFDGSELSLGENIEITKEVVKLAKEKEVFVEGEVGIIGGELTVPQDAERFVKETGVDNLAINVGTMHGMPEEGEALEDIDFQRLGEIRGKVAAAGLVLHGGSGVTPGDIKKAIQLGIVKININSELRSIFTKNLKESLNNNQEEIIPYKYMRLAIATVQKTVEEKIKLFESNVRT